MHLLELREQWLLTRAVASLRRLLRFGLFQVRALLALVSEEHLVALGELLLETGDLQLQLLRVAAAQRVQLLRQLREQT